MERLKIIIKTSIIGIIVNIFLVIFKMIIGLISNSIAIILDAVNNLSDVTSSVITIIGTKLSNKKPDKKHPYGHGRIEYITSVLVSIIVLIVGFLSIKESIEKIINPIDTKYTAISFVIIIFAILTKFIMGSYVKKVGTQINSQALIASGLDAFFDSILSLGTLISAILSFTFKINIEGFIGSIISLFIIKSGIDILLETLDSIIGTRIDSNLSKSVKNMIGSFKEVRGVYDLTLHNYGPVKIIGSVHIEVKDTMTAFEIHTLSRKIMAEVFKKFGIILTIGIYASNEDFPKIKDTVNEVVKKYDEVLQFHGLYVDNKKKIIAFDLIIDFKADANKIKEQIIEELKEKYKEYSFDILLDIDFSD